MRWRCVGCDAVYGWEVSVCGACLTAHPDLTGTAWPPAGYAARAGIASSPVCQCGSLDGSCHGRGTACGPVVIWTDAGMIALGLGIVPRRVGDAYLVPATTVSCDPVGAPICDPLGGLRS